MCKVSVIMPSLNVADYIDEALYSVVNQTMRDIEILCVDAGSTDGTLEIIRKYADQDPRIHLINSEIKSYGYQMNLAIDRAEGEYIGIVETDDYILENMYEELYETASENGSDIVWADYYRFTGSGDNLRKRLFQVAYTSMYGRNLKVSEYLQCFTFMTTNWCGIYKSSFLKNNNIRHNETPGASFQDISFRFLTFMYAESIFFVNKAYYMNRRDNPGSSVFNTNKVFCCCDEFKYIYDNMSRNKELFDTFKFIYAKKLYMVYSSNLKRIPSDCQREFLMRFSEEMKKIRDMGMIDFKIFSVVDNDIISLIIEDPDKYFDDFLSPYLNARDRIRKSKNIIIYGLGKLGRTLWIELIYRFDPADVIAFAVSKKGYLQDFYQGTPVKEISELTEYAENGTVVVAAATKHHRDILANLERSGFKNIIVLPNVQDKIQTGIVENDPDHSKSLSKWYKRITGKDIDLLNPRTFNEKMQWLKIYDVNPLKKEFANRIRLYDRVRNNIDEDILPEVIGIYDSVEEIPFESLPDSYVIKCSNASDRSIEINRKYQEKDTYFDAKKRELQNWLSDGNYVLHNGFRMEYGYEKARLIVEKKISDRYPENSYKILCFEGVPRYVVYDSNKTQYAHRFRDVFDINWEWIPVQIRYINSPQTPPKPEHFEDMKRIAEKLSEPFAFAAIHMFDTPERTVLIDVKFSYKNGVEPVPEKTDLEWGELIHLESLKK